MGPNPIGLLSIQDTDTDQRATTRRHSKKVAIFKPRRKALRETIMPVP